MNSDQDQLKAHAYQFQIVDFVKPVFESKQFANCSGSGDPKHHHYGDGGLATHTFEVVSYCYSIYKQHYAITSGSINIAELLVSAYWHDYGKIWDYQKISGKWSKHDNHARTVGHITKSVIEFEKHYDTLTLDSQYRINKQNIIHNILSHHGCREWGSPVSPATREAWILHLADMLSARLNDYDRYDKF